MDLILKTALRMLSSCKKGKLSTFITRILSLQYVPNDYSKNKNKILKNYQKSFIKQSLHDFFFFLLNLNSLEYLVTDKQFFFNPPSQS